MTRGGILLLGGGGFIGQALARSLSLAGEAVTIVAPHPPVAGPLGLTWCEGCIEDIDLVRSLLPDARVVIHLATTTTPGTYRSEPAREAEENLLPLLRLLELMEEYRDTRLVFLSTGGAIYGNPETLPVSEAHPPAPLSFHAAGKAAAEQFLGVFARRGYPVTILRPANAYGPGQRLKRGFGVIPTLLEHCLRGTTMEIWGDGEAMRDYLYIDDLTDACLRLIARPVSGTFNLGSGVGHTLNELCRLAREVTGKPLDVHYRPGRGADVKAIVLDSTAFQRAFEWQTRVDLREGIARTWQWRLAQP